MKPKRVPDGARHIRTYREFGRYLQHFVDGFYPFLWIVGRPGLTKTESILAALRSRQVYYRKGGQLTPLQFHKDLYAHRGQPILLDDAEHLLDDKKGRKLVSALGEQKPTKQLDYGSTCKQLEDVPQSFITTSPLCIIANEGTVHGAIQSRAITIYFDPTNLELHQAAATWFWDQEIHDYYGRHLYRLPPLDVRWYVHTYNDKRAGEDWRQLVLRDHAPQRGYCVVQELETDGAYPTREDKAKRFEALMSSTGGGSRASYFRIVKRLEEQQQLIPHKVDPIPLKNTTAPAIPSLIELVLMELGLPMPPEEEPAAENVPAREAFTAPITGTVPPSPPTDSPPAPPTPPAPDNRPLPDQAPFEIGPRPTMPWG